MLMENPLCLSSWEMRCPYKDSKTEGKRVERQDILHLAVTMAAVVAVDAALNTWRQMTRVLKSIAEDFFKFKPLLLVLVPVKNE